MAVIITKRKLFILIGISFLFIITYTLDSDSVIRTETDHLLKDLNEHDILNSDMIPHAFHFDNEEYISPPCTIVNPLTNQFFDLRPLGSLGAEGETQSWNAKGFDYGRNFSLGVCSTPLRQLTNLNLNDFESINNKSAIGAFYSRKDGSKVSIGQVSTDLKFRGKKLIVEYENGDICHELFDKNGNSLKKTTLISFTCDREMMSKAKAIYVGSFNDCSYHFEIRTIHACATSNEESDDAVWIIFIFISLAALVVYYGAHHLYKLIKLHYERSVRPDLEAGPVKRG